MNVALLIIFAFLALSIYLGIRARRGKDMNLEEWSVGGRGFGTIFIFLLLAGEIYTTFTFLGASGWAYGRGGPAFYILSYGALAYVMSYWLLPAVWRYAKENRLHSQSDFFVSKYRSTRLGVDFDGKRHHGVGDNRVPRAVPALRLLRGHRGYVPAGKRREAGLPRLARRGPERPVVHLHGAADRFGILHVAAHLRLCVLGPERTGHPAQRHLSADLPAGDALRVLRRFRLHTPDTRSRRAAGRPLPAQDLPGDVRSLAGRPDRCRRSPRGPGAGLDAPHGLGDGALEERLQGVQARGERGAGRQARQDPRAAGRARGDGLRAHERPRPGAPPAPGIRFRHPALPSPGLQLPAEQLRHKVGCGRRRLDGGCYSSLPRGLPDQATRCLPSPGLCGRHQRRHRRHARQPHRPRPRQPRYPPLRGRPGAARLSENEGAVKLSKGAEYLA